MAKINQIQKAILELDGGAFQKFADSYLYKKGYEQINPIGSVVGENKVKPGTPDTLIPNSNGKYVFAEHTTIKPNKVYAKYCDDIDKCFDETKTKISINKIEEIVLCYTSQLSTENIEELRKKCEVKGVNLNLFGIGPISYDLLEKYPGLAKDYLGVEIDTGQIVSLDTFLNLYSRSKFATPLDNTFQFRDEEMKNLLSSIEKNDLIIITGPAGVGKSKIAVECYQKFLEKDETYDAYCIFNQGVDLFEDLKVYFSDSKNYLIFVDDANRISGFRYIIDLVNRKRDDQNFKVIVTTRDYALDNIRVACKRLHSVAEITLKILTDDEIKKIITDEFQISSSLFLDRIVNISQGNPRLAMMAAKVAKESDSLESLGDATGLYDEYYSSIKSDLDSFQDETILKVLGIITFYRIVDRANSDLMSEINDIFRVSDDKFWEAAITLHDSEVLDMYENEIVKISDQVLSTYFFYVVFLKEKIVDFFVLLDGLFPKYKNRLVDAINPIVNTLNFEETKKELIISVDKVWDKIQATDEKAFLDLIGVFWFLKPTETLVYIQTLIQGMASKNEPIERIQFKAEDNSKMPDFVSTLSLFRFLSQNEIKISLDLLFEFIEKRPDLTPGLLNYLINRYGFELESFRFGYVIQKNVIIKIIERCDSGENEYFSRLLISLSENYLKTHFESARTIKNRAVQFTRFNLVSSKYIFELRKLIWDNLLTFYNKLNLREFVINMLYNHVKSRQDLTVKEIVEEDFKSLLPFFENNFQSDDIYHCLIVQKYIKILEKLKINYDEKFKVSFEFDALKLYDFFTNRLERKELKLNQEEYKKYRIKKIREFLGEFSKQDYEKLFADFYKFSQITSEGNNWSIQSGCNYIFEELLSRDLILFKEVFEDYLKRGDYLNVHSIFIVHEMINSIGSEATYNLISSQSFKKKDQWLFVYFSGLPEGDIDEKALKDLSFLFRNAERENFIYSLDYLLKYEIVQKGFVIDVVQIMLKRIEENELFAHSLSMFFNHLTEFNKELLKLFSGKMELIEDVFLVLCRVKEHVDYNASVFSKFLDNDIEFIDKYIGSRYETKRYLSKYDDKRDYSLLWKRDNYMDVMKRIIELVFKKEKRGRSFSYIGVFFNKGVHPQDNETIIKRQNNFMNIEIENNLSNTEYINFLFNIISSWKPDRKFKFYELVLSKNIEYEGFEKLPFSPSSMSWTGSEAPILAERVEFLEQIKSICGSVKFLKHRLFIEKRINSLRMQIQAAQKHDFTEEWG